MFQKQNIPLTITDLFSSLFSDYISQSSQVKSFYNGHFSLKDFSKSFLFIDLGVSVSLLLLLLLLLLDDTKRFRITEDDDGTLI